MRASAEDTSKIKLNVAEFALEALAEHWDEPQI